MTPSEAEPLIRVPIVYWASDVLTGSPIVLATINLALLAGQPLLWHRDGLQAVIPLAVMQNAIDEAWTAQSRASALPWTRTPQPVTIRWDQCEVVQ